PRPACAPLSLLTFLLQALLALVALRIEVALATGRVRALAAVALRAAAAVRVEVALAVGARRGARRGDEAGGQDQREQKRLQHGSLLVGVGTNVPICRSRAPIVARTRGARKRAPAISR